MNSKDGSYSLESDIAIADILVAYKTRENEFPKRLSQIEAEAELLKARLLRENQDSVASRRLLVINDIENRLEVTAHIWQTAMDFTTLPQQITGLKAHPENKPTVLKALSHWCEAQDALLQDLKALESRLPIAD
ncbi:MAG: hypothetical protein IT324_23165 [Anaerolineae bacterium]|nr:hypothetical protein [Anaerolineae bacterium]